MQQAVKLYDSWAMVPDWRNESAYPPAPIPSAALMWWGVEFLRRQSAFLAKLKARLSTITAGDLDGMKIYSGHLWLPCDMAAELIPEWPRPRNFPHFASGDEVSRGRAGYVHLTFNLAHPIDEQIERARSTLKRWQDDHVKAGVIGNPAQHKRVQNRLLPLYLRMLDAEASGASPSQVADHLSLSDPRGVAVDQVTKWTEAARRYRDKDYVVLLERIGE